MYSTLHFVTAQAKRYDVTPVMTFDQPLYWEAMMTIRSQPDDSNMKYMVMRLGGFHMPRSFLGSSGHMMADSGLQELIESAYASNTVSHMLTGKAVARAVRGHLLVDDALNTTITPDTYMYNVPVTTKQEADYSEAVGVQHIPERSDDETHDLDTDTITTDLTAAAELYDRAVSCTCAFSVEEVCSSEALVRRQSKVNGKKETMTGRTATLWLQYLEMVDILRRFLKAERTGNWRLHLQSVRKMLPYFAAAGHKLYAKAAYVYLQAMTMLPEIHPDVHQKFEEGYHVVRRSDRYGVGLFTDLIIEQVLMRSVKTHSGLTRGKDMAETQRLLWVMLMPACANMNDAMQKFTGVSYETSDQHKDISKARQVRDVNDTLNLISYLAHT